MLDSLRVKSVRNTCPTVCWPGFLSGRLHSDDISRRPPDERKLVFCSGEVYTRLTVALIQPPSTPPTSCASPCVATPAEQSRWFNEEIHAHDSQLKSYLRGSFPKIRDVDDVVQESYLRIWKARAVHPIHSAKAFLFRVARHVALDLVRRNHRSPIDPAGDLSTLYVLEEKPRVAGVDEKIDLLSDAIAGLPDRRREIVVLRKLKRLSQKEVARQLGLSERTVENQLSRGIKQCRRYLQSRGIESLFGDEE